MATKIFSVRTIIWAQSTPLLTHVDFQLYAERRPAEARARVLNTYPEAMKSDVFEAPLVSVPVAKGSVYNPR